MPELANQHHLNQDQFNRRPLPVFDKEAVLKRMMGDQNLANRVLYVFTQDMPRQIQTLLQRVGEGNLQSASEQAHRIKGACCTVGGEAMRAVAYEIETAALHGDLAALSAKVAELQLQFDQLCAVIAPFTQVVRN